MNEDAKKLHYLRYMRAHIRAQNPVCIQHFTNLELFEAFKTLREPEVPFEIWEGDVGLNENAAPAQPAPDAGPSDEEIERTNGAGLAALASLAVPGGPVTITEGKPADPPAEPPKSDGKIDQSFVQEMAKRGIPVTIRQEP
jgi:hypothetical protein